MSEVPNIAKTSRLSQHLDLETQLEVFNLKEKLQEMTEKVLQLLQHMELLEKTPGILLKTHPQAGSVAIGTQTSIVEEEQQTEGFNLKEKMRELMDMNINWQKYNTLQEKSIHELSDKIEQLQQKLKTEQQMNLTLNEKLNSENLRLKREVEELKLKLDVVQSGKHPTFVNMEREQLLEAQLLIFKEDFQTERKDREKAQEKAVQLEMQLLDLQRQMQMTSFRSHLNTFDSSSGENDKSHQNSPAKSRTRCDLGTDDTDGLSDPNMVVPHDCTIDKKFYNSGKVRASTANQSCVKDDLRCTRCFKVFLRSEHLELLDHIEQCDSL